MTAQIFPESFYTKLLSNKERISISENGKFEILPPESYFSRLNRFFTFQQDANIDSVHSRFKSLVEQVTNKEGLDFPALTDEIHSHGKSKYLFLEANLCLLREKLDRVGQLNYFSKLIFKIVNAVRHLFGFTPIELKTYADISYELDDDIPWGAQYYKRTEREFRFDWDQGNLSNPFAQASLELFPKDEVASRFTAKNEEVRIELQKLENQLNDFYVLHQIYKDYGDHKRGIGTQQILANLEVNFDQEQNCFLAAIHNPRWRANHSPFPKQDGKKFVTRAFRAHLNELPDEAKTFRFFVKVKDDEHELKWVAKVSECAPYQLDKGSESLELKPGFEYSFFDEDRNLISSFTIIEKN